ncbi:MAG: dihydrodipicolinate synthase family protein [Pirellulales bacterium]
MTRAVDPQRLRTVHLVPLTALSADGRLNLDAQARHTAAMAAAGVRVFLPAAGTGEFHSLTADEILAIVRTTREAAAGALVFAPVGGPIGQALDVGGRALAAGADGLLFMPFQHPYLSDEGARDYYLAVLDRLAAPSMIYKTAPIPSNDVLCELASDPRVIAVKYAVNSLHEFRGAVRRGGACEWLCGSAERFAPYFMLAGASGYTSGAANLCPRISLAMHAAFAERRTDEGFRLQQLLLPIEEFRARDGDSYGISMLKHALACTGTPVGPPRPPQRQLTRGEQAQIEALLPPILEAEAALAAHQPDLSRTR